MKTRDFERILIEAGYTLISSNNHKKWIRGSHSVMTVHAREMNKMVVRRILREMENNKELPKAA